MLFVFVEPLRTGALGLTLSQSMRNLSGSVATRHCPMPALKYRGKLFNDVGDYLSARLVFLFVQGVDFGSW